MSNKEHHHATMPRFVAIVAYGMGVAALASAAVAVFVLAVLGNWRAEAAVGQQVLRGKYLVTLGLCTDCHTPGYFFGKPDKARFLGGSEVGFHIPDLGVFHGPNLTPDEETGLGRWSADDIVKAIQTGVRPDGRVLGPIMPWHAFAELTREDAYAIAAFLKSLPPVSNKVPGPFGPTETPTSYVFKVLAPASGLPSQ
jgi:mono/diheme cytochrome c family protein